MTRQNDTFPPAARQPIDVGATLRALHARGQLEQFRTRQPTDALGELLEWYRRDGWPMTPDLIAALRECDPAETLAWLRAADARAA